MQAAAEAAGLTTFDAALRWMFSHSSLRPGDCILLGASSLAQLGRTLESVVGWDEPSA